MIVWVKKAYFPADKQTRHVIVLGNPSIIQIQDFIHEFCHPDHDNHIHSKNMNNMNNLFNYPIAALKHIKKTIHLSKNLGNVEVDMNNLLHMVILREYYD